MENAIVSGSETDIFGTQPVQHDIVSGQWMQYQAPAFEPRSGPINFNIEGDEQYVDLNSTFLTLTARVVDTRPNKIPMAPECVVAPTNNWLHTLFSQVTLYINGKAVNQSHNMYHYKAYLENLLSYGTDARKTYLQGEGFYRDSAAHMDSLDNNLNKGFRQRGELCARSRIVQLKGRLHLDLFNQPHLLLNNTPIRITLDRNKHALTLMHAPPDGNAANDHEKAEFAMEVLSAVLDVRKVTLAPPLRLAHINALNTTTAKYPIRRTVPFSIQIPQGTVHLSKANVTQGQLPRRVTVGIVSGEAERGVCDQNPFNFHHWNMTSLQLSVGGTPHPVQPMKFDFATNQHLEGFMSLFIGTGQYGSDEGNMLSRDEYGKGFTLCCFNLTPDLDYEDDHYSSTKTGNLDVSVSFQQGAPQPLTMIVLAEFDNTIEVDRYRQVFLDYMA